MQGLISSCEKEKGKKEKKKQGQIMCYMLKNMSKIQGPVCEFSPSAESLFKIIQIFSTSTYEVMFEGQIKGIFSDSNNIFLWHKLEDINKKKRLFPKFQLILILRS